MADAALLLEGRSPATTRATRPASTRRSPTTRPRSTSRVDGAPHRRRPRVLRRGARPRGRGRGPRGGPGLRDAGADDQGGLAAALQVRRRRPTTSSPRPRLEQPGPLRRRRSTATAPRTRRVPRRGRPPLIRMMMASRAEGFGAEVQAADHARHVRPLGRLRRPVLQPGPEGPRADPQRLRRGLQGGATSCSARPRRPPRSSSASRTADPLAMYLSDIYTITANLAGIPGTRASPAG